MNTVGKSLDFRKPPPRRSRYLITNVGGDGSKKWGDQSHIGATQYHKSCYRSNKSRIVEELVKQTIIAKVDDYTTLKESN